MKKLLILILLPLMACAKPKVETFFNNERNASITKTCIENNCKVSYKNETNTGEIIRNIRQEQISIDKINENYDEI